MKDRKVLVIDDDALNMKLIKAILSKKEIEVIEASDAPKGLELAAQHMPDAILMDMNLPGLDGMTATRQLKADPSLKDISVIAVTGFVGSEFQEKAMEAGCSGFVEKPISVASLLKALDQVLND